jgi:hypothetical protein
MDFKVKIPGLADAKALLDSALAKVDPLLNDYKNATKKLEGLGFRTGKVTVSMGLLPVVHTSLIGEVAGVDVARLTAMKEENKDDKVLTTLLEALILAKQIHGRIESKLESMTLHVALGIPPSVSVEFT